MPRWLKLVRGTLGTGIAFAVAGPIIVGAIASLFWLFGDLKFEYAVGAALRSAPLSFVLGVAFSGVLALVARGQAIERLSVRTFGAIGGGIGLTAWAAMGLTGAFSAWSPGTAVVNLVLATSIGAGSAAATLALARRARGGLAAGEDVQHLGTGAAGPIQYARSAVPADRGVTRSESD